MMSHFINYIDRTNTPILGQQFIELEFSPLTFEKIIAISAEVNKKTRGSN